MGQTKQGALRGKAAKAGVTPDEYVRRTNAGEKWCYACKRWRPVDWFSVDVSRWDGRNPRCRECVSESGRARYVPKVRTKPPGPPPAPARDGDKVQARGRVNRRVKAGFLTHPNALPCADCGHVWKHGERRHEYDHYLGYGASHQFDVQAVCTTCHTRRAEARGETVKDKLKGAGGRFIKSKRKEVLGG